MIVARAGDAFTEFDFEPGLVLGVEISQTDLKVRTHYTRANFIREPLESLAFERRSIHRITRYGTSGLVVLVANNVRDNLPVPGYAKMSGGFP